MAIFRRELPSPKDVFVPAKIPLEETNVYAPRSGPEADLDRYLSRAQVPVVFGEFGVGKTTLVLRHLSEVEAEGRLIYIPSASDRSLTDISAAVYEHLDYSVQVESTEGRDLTAKGGLNILIAETGAEGTESKATRSERVVDRPTVDKLLGIMEDARLVLVVDEMHKADEELREKLADLIKTARGRNADFPAIVLIGTTLDAEQLVRKDTGIDRFIKELPVDPMTDDEARFIVVEGFGGLKIEIVDEIVEKVVRTAAGAPTIVQEVCLNMAERSEAEHRRPISVDDYAAAVRTYLRDHGRRLASVYIKSIEQVGPRKYRKQILRAMAAAPHDFVNLEQIRAGVSELLDDEVPSTALSGPLRELKSGDDSILQDVERHSGDRVYNLSAFRDPMMKSFIRFMDEVEQQGLLPSDLS